MADFLGLISSFFNQALNWVQEILDLIVTTPALLVLVIAMPIVGFAVGLLSRLIRA